MKYGPTQICTICRANKTAKIIEATTADLDLFAILQCRKRTRNFDIETFKNKVKNSVLNSVDNIDDAAKASKTLILEKL